MTAIIVYFHSMGLVDGVEYGNAITQDHDPIEYAITRAEFTQQYPENLYVSSR